MCQYFFVRANVSIFWPKNWIWSNGWVATEYCRRNFIVRKLRIKHKFQYPCDEKTNIVCTLVHSFSVPAPRFFARCYHCRIGVPTSVNHPLHEGSLTTTGFVILSTSRSRTIFQPLIITNASSTNGDVGPTLSPQSQLEWRHWGTHLLQLFCLLLGLQLYLIHWRGHSHRHYWFPEDSVLPMRALPGDPRSWQICRLGGICGRCEASSTLV